MPEKTNNADNRIKHYFCEEKSFSGKVLSKRRDSVISNN